MGTIKGRSGIDLAEAEDIKKRWQEYTEGLYKKKGLNDLGNHDVVASLLKLDTLECVVKWALGVNTANKLSGGEGIPVKLFEILDVNMVKVMPSIG